tara:strand:- start:924 stop:1913 length:990 start_codon:yes stop_codon:yes gene_type:complete
MSKEALTAIAAGLASAFAAMAFMSGVAFALGLVYFAPLPIFMVGLAYGNRAAIIAALTGTLVISIFGGMVMVVVFAFLQATPAWMIVQLALMMRKSPSSEGSLALLGSKTMAEWMPPGVVLSAIAIFAAILLLGSAILARESGLSSFVSLHLDQIFMSIAPRVDTFKREQMTQVLIPLFPGTVVTSWLIMITINSVAAQSLLVRLSQNKRPRIKYIELNLPNWLSWPLVSAAFLALLGSGEWKYFGQNLTMVLAIPYFFVGLAVVHSIARRVTATMPILITFYLIIVFSIWAALIVAGIGIIEQWFGVRSHLPRKASGNRGANDIEDER